MAAASTRRPRRTGRRKPAGSSLLSDQLRTIIGGCGMTGYELEQKTGVSRSILCRFLNGLTSLSLETIEALPRSWDLNSNPPRRPLKTTTNRPRSGPRPPWTNRPRPPRSPRRQPLSQTTRSQGFTALGPWPNAIRAMPRIRLRKKGTRKRATGPNPPCWLRGTPPARQ